MFRCQATRGFISSFISVYIGTRERHLESILQSSLKQIILVKNFPRSLIQIVLQITTSPENEYANTKLVQASLVRILRLILVTTLFLLMILQHADANPKYQNLPIVPALLQTAVLALLSGGIPLKTTATATAVSVVIEDGNSKFVADPSPREGEDAQSTHVFAFTSHDELLLVESEGDFSMEEWQGAHDTAKRICCETSKKAGVDMILDDENSEGPDLRHFIRSALEAKVASDLHWK